MTPQRFNQMMSEFRPAILLEAIQDVVHVFTAHSDAADYASWALTVGVVVYMGWIGAARLGLRPRLCGVAGAVLFIVSFAFSSALTLIAHPQANPFLNFAAGLFVTFLLSPLALVVALLGVVIARLTSKIKPAAPSGR
jgi:hypothetical protein